MEARRRVGSLILKKILCSNLHWECCRIRNDNLHRLQHELEEWISWKGKRNVRSWQQLAGWMNWCLNVYPLLRPALSNVYEKLRSQSQDFFDIGNLVLRNPCCTLSIACGNMISHAMYCRLCGFLITYAEQSTRESQAPAKKCFVIFVRATRSFRCFICTKMSSSLKLLESSELISQGAEAASALS